MREFSSQIKEIALNYKLMSNFTAFVAVDSSHRTEGKTGTTVSQAVPVPEGEGANCVVVLSGNPLDTSVYCVDSCHG